MAFVVKAVKGVFGGNKQAAAPSPAAPAPEARGPRITPLGAAAAQAYDPRRRRLLRTGLPGDTVLSDKLG